MHLCEQLLLFMIADGLLSIEAITKEHTIVVSQISVTWWFVTQCHSFHFFQNAFNERLQLWNIILYGVPHTERLDCVITLNKNVAHTFYAIPIYLRMLFPKIFGQHINSFANNLHLLHKTKENNWVILDCLKTIFFFVVKDDLNICRICSKRPLSLTFSLIY